MWVVCGLSATSLQKRRKNTPHSLTVLPQQGMQARHNNHGPLVRVKEIYISVCGEVWAVPVVAWNMVGARACN